MSCAGCFFGFLFVFKYVQDSLKYLISLNVKKKKIKSEKRRKLCSRLKKKKNPEESSRNVSGREQLSLFENTIVAIIQLYWITKTIYISMKKV